MELSVDICSSPLEGPRGLIFQGYEKSICEETTASLKSYVIGLLCRLEITVESDATELGNLNAIRIIGYHWQHSGTKGKVGVVTIMDSRVKAVIRTS